MNQTAIFGPVFAMLALTFSVWTYMYCLRIPFIRRGNLGPDELRPLEFARVSPPRVSNPSDNLKNLFEMPVLFYTLAIYLFVSHQVDIIYIVAAWMFALFRILHSVVHCTVNIILLRFGVYVVSTIILLLIALRAAAGHFGL